MTLLEAQLQAQTEAMSAVLSSHLERVELGRGGGGGGGAVGGALASAALSDTGQHSSAATQTEADETQRHWQQQLIAVSEWLQSGAALMAPVAALQSGASSAEAQQVGARGAGDGSEQEGS